MKRVLIYVHFNRDDKLANYVVHQLQEMNSLFDKVLFITNSKIVDEDKKRLNGLYDDFLQRENIGFDFAAYRDGINRLGWTELGKYDSLTIMNDTCFGPLRPMSGVYGKMEKSDADFWGMTMHEYSKIGMPGTNGPVPEHIQSYFLVFGKNVIRSKEFHDFWKSVKDSDDVEYVIQKYESQLTPILGKNYKYDVLVRSKGEFFPNITYFLPKTLLDRGLPFIKIKAFTENIDTLSPNGLVRYIKRHTQYPVEYIYKEINGRLQGKSSMGFAIQSLPYKIRLRNASRDRRLKHLVKVAINYKGEYRNKKK